MKPRSLSPLFRFSLLAPLAFGALAVAENKMPDITVDPTPMERSHENSFAPIVEKVSPSVVTISISKNMRVGGRAQGGNPLMDDPFFRKFFGMPEDDAGKDKGGDSSGRRALSCRWDSAAV